MTKIHRSKRKIASSNFGIPVIYEIKKRMDVFTPRQRGLAEFILYNPETLAFFTITELAKKTNISEATIVRFCNTLGYDGYAHLVKEVQQTIQSELGTVGRFQFARSMRSETIEKQNLSAFERVLANEIDNLVNLMKSIKSTDFYQCVKIMMKADQICIIGCMASSCLASYFGYTLAKIFTRVFILQDHGPMTSAVYNSLGPNSLVFLISFPRYPKTTMELGQLVSKKGVKIVTITNSPISPIVPLATLSFFVPVGIISFVDTYAAPMALINALITEFSERNPEETQRALKQFDEYASQESVFLKSGRRIGL